MCTKKDDVSIEAPSAHAKLFPVVNLSSLLHLQTRRMHLCHKGHANVFNPALEKTVDAFLRIDTLGLRL